MATSDPVQILLAHDRWATQNIIQACEKITDEQFHHRFEMGLGSLHNTLRHILGAMKGWGDLLAGREQSERLEAAGDLSAQQMNELLDSLSADMHESANAHPTDEIVTGSHGGMTYSFTRGAVLTHVTTHGMHHRAQCLNMLRHLGVDPLPPSSIMEWTMMADTSD